MKLLRHATFFLVAAALCGCGNEKPVKSTTAEEDETIYVNEDSLRRVYEDSIRREHYQRMAEMYRYDNSMKGHDERDTIEGNFTGRGIARLFVVQDTTYESPNYDTQLYYIRSDNKRLPPIPVYACGAPKLVNEGDLDGNGTCEFGFLQPWNFSRYRYYFILTFTKGSWRYLFLDNCLATPYDDFRSMDIEIAKPGPRKGKVLINYGYEGYDEKTNEQIFEVRQKIVTPTYKKVDLSTPISYF